MPPSFPTFNTWISQHQKSQTINQSQNPKQTLQQITQLITQLSHNLHQIRTIQETLLVPAISLLISPKTQKSFNNRVLLQLGLLESRIHLVGMHDAVVESGVESERIAFEKEIPYVARMMIERWRESLYVPKAGMLEYGLV